MYFIEFGDPGCMCGSRRKVRPKIISLPGRLTLFPALFIYNINDHKLEVVKH